MKRVWAWCEIIMESPGSDNDQVTHGICPACFDSLIARAGLSSGKRLDSHGKVIETNS